MIRRKLPYIYSILFTLMVMVTLLPSVYASSMSISPSTIYAGTGIIPIVCTGTSTSWTSSTVFSATESTYTMGAFGFTNSLGSSYTSTSATVWVNPPLGTGTMTLSDGAGDTATLTISANPYANFDFSTVPGLQHWYKSDSLSGSNGASIGTWTDSGVGAVNLTQATGSAKPTLVTSGLGGLSSLNFNKTNSQNLAGVFAENYQNPVSIYVVYQQNQLTTPGTYNQSGYMWALGGSTFSNISGSSSPVVSQEYSNPGGSSAAVSAGYFPATPSLNGPSPSVGITGLTATKQKVDAESMAAVETFVYDGTQVFLHRNGRDKRYAATGSLTAPVANSTFQIGGLSGFFSNYQVSEILVCNVANDLPTQHAIVEALSAKYGGLKNPQLISDGDSTTSLININGGTYANLSPAASPAGLHWWSGVECSVSGQNMRTDTLNVSQRIDYFLAGSNRVRNIVFCNGGTNDLAGNGAIQTVLTGLAANYITYAKSVHSVNGTLVVAPITPRNKADTSYDLIRQQWGSILRSFPSGYIDAYADFAKDPKMGQYEESSNPNTYNPTDAVHPSGTGVGSGPGFLGPIVAAAVNSLDNGVVVGNLSIGTPTTTNCPLTANVATGGSGTYTYQLYRAMDTVGGPGPFYTVGSSSGSVPTGDSTVEAGKVYWYKLKATDTSGTPLINYSNIVQAQIPAIVGAATTISAEIGNTTGWVGIPVPLQFNLSNGSTLGSSVTVTLSGTGTFYSSLTVASNGTLSATTTTAVLTSGGGPITVWFVPSAAGSLTLSLSYSGNAGLTTGPASVSFTSLAQLVGASLTLTPGSTSLGVTSSAATGGTSSYTYQYRVSPNVFNGSPSAAESSNYPNLFGALNSSSGSTAATLTGLTASTTYWVQQVITDSGGNSIYGTGQMFTTIASTTIGVRGGLSAGTELSVQSGINN